MFVCIVYFYVLMYTCVYGVLLCANVCVSVYGVLSVHYLFVPICDCVYGVLACLNVLVCMMYLYV